MKVLIIGASGVIGFQALNHLKKKNDDVYYTFFSNKIENSRSFELDIRNRDEVESLFKKIHPDVVIHTSAVTNVDLCETNHNLANSINVKGTQNIVDACKKTKSKIIYVSTSFVFNGSKLEYYEDDKPSPSTYYGITKYKGEEYIRNSKLPFLILRTDQPYCWTKSWQHTNSVIRVLNTIKAGNKFNEIVNWYNTPTYVPNFVEILEKLISNEYEGIFHLVGSDYVNRYEWSLLVAKYFHLDQNLINPINSEELGLSAKRVNVNLKNEKIFRTLGIRMMGIKEGLTAMVNESIDIK